jgi:transcriptional regulator with XRE-family HTH domain
MEFNGKAVAAVISRLRRERRQSQEVLSGLAAMARSHLSMVETGEMLPTLPTLWRLAEAFGLRPSELVAMIEDEMSKMDGAGGKEEK